MGGAAIRRFFSSADKLQKRQKRKTGGEKMPPRRKKVQTEQAPSMETGMFDMLANPDRMGTTHEASLTDFQSDAVSEHSVACVTEEISDRRSPSPEPDPKSDANADDADADDKKDANRKGEKNETDAKGEGSGVDAATRRREAFVKLSRFKAIGQELTRPYAPDDSADTMEAEVLLQEAMVRDRLKEQRAKDGVRFSRRMLLAFTSFSEFMNKRYDPFNIDLEGWSDSVMENITDYDRPFERLIEKYQGRAEMTPEAEFLATLGSSMFMFHLSKSLASRMAAPIQKQKAHKKRAPVPKLAVSDASDSE
jgi:hypothetical protein